jgi:hypothetical protein
MLLYPLSISETIGLATRQRRSKSHLDASRAGSCSSPEDKNVRNYKHSPSAYDNITFMKVWPAK